MNYIRHLTAFYMKAKSDDRLSPAHISLYHALFQVWNINRFKNPISINRKILMLYSKIGSNHTFYGCLNDLNNWGYIEYLPSHSPSVGSFVNLCSFDITETENTDSSCADSAQQQCKNDTTDGANSAQLRCNFDITTCAKMHPYINNIKHTNNKTFIKGNSQAQNPEVEISDLGKNEESLKSDSDKKAKRKKVAPKKEKVFVPPGIEDAIEFFKDEKYPEVEARKFFYHFEANGWKVGGKTPMQNWQAAAHNWMLNATRYETESRSNPVKLNNSKDYGEPL
ncbi:MAG: hypothetical protein QM786_06865 [Breznakibacter sp.]